MIDNIARVLKTDVSRVNMKARTHEKVDSVGECRALEREWWRERNVSSS